MYFILISLGFLVGYVGLLALESRRGARFFASRRTRLDQAVEQGTFIVMHVDFAHAWFDTCARRAWMCMRRRRAPAHSSARSPSSRGISRLHAPICPIFN